MPQMAPINWMSLFIMFVMSLIMFTSMNYFYKMETISSKSNQLIKSKITWKW